MYENGFPRVSVVIPVYNRQELLNRALASVLQQSYPVESIIVVDDGSVPAINAPYADPRIEVIRIPHSGMPGKVRNIGIAKVQSPWVAFLDSDDQWLSEKLAQQCKVLEQAHADTLCVFTQEYWMRKGRLRRAPQPIRDQKDLFSAALQKCVMGPSTAMVQTEALRAIHGFREDLVFAEDYECWIRLLLRGAAHPVEEPLVLKYANMGDNLSEQVPMQEWHRLRGLAGIFEAVQNDALQAEAWQRDLIFAVLQKKFAIVHKGAKKHANAAILTWLADLQKKFPF